MSLRITYPWPDSALIPHAKGHWRKKSALTKGARGDADLITQAEGRRVGLFDAPRHELWIEFYPPDNRRRDVMNVIGACKAMIDGIADALGIDDSELVIHWPPRFSSVVHKGLVAVNFSTEGEDRHGK